MAVYIKGIGNISPQHTFDNDSFLDDFIEYEEKFLLATEPNYKDFLPAKSRRRMSKIVKMGVTAALHSLKDAGIETPDAIITGTGLGCLKDTEKFMTAIINDKEKFLTPISFIQSTHNTVGGTIAIMLKCYGYNFTYVHRGFSFESALMDGFMMTNENESGNYLIGGVDEMTENFYKTRRLLGRFKDEEVKNTELNSYKIPGNIPGEGASFFVLSNDKTTGKTYGSLDAMTTFYRPKDNTAVEKEITAFLERNNLTLEDIDCVVLGNSGDKENDEVFLHLQEHYFQKQIQTYFKHLCGEYYTASGFGFWQAVKIASTQRVPDSIRLNEIDRPIKKVLMYNHYNKVNHSLILVSHVGV